MPFEELTAPGAVPTPVTTPVRIPVTTPVQTPVLTVVQHDADVPLDLFADWLVGVEIAVVRAWAGEVVPTDPAAVGGGLIVLGGNMNAYADDVATWLPATRALLAAAVAADVPTLGICLGAQLLAVSCGGRVEVAAPPGHEAGIARIQASRGCGRRGPWRARRRCAQPDQQPDEQLGKQPGTRFCAPA